MSNNTHVAVSILFLYFLTPLPINAQPASNLGQTIEIQTELHDYTGRPSWLLIIRDIDHNQTIPYLYDFERGGNQWLAFTYGRDYLVLASILSFSPYTHDPYRTVKIHNFCNLETHGHILRNKSIAVRLKGELTSNHNTYACYASYYPGNNFYIETDPLDNE